MSVIIQSEDFDPGDEIAHLGEGDASVGAVASFVGLVRGDDDLGQMTLEHYAGFAEAEISKHVAEAERRWALSAVRVIHRVGALKPGDRIVFVGVASAHREAAFDACHFLIDYLKTRAPFWKEETRGGASSWVEPNPKDAAAAKKW
jgi:molybdopterin synthase catalytic subunit